MPLASSEGSHSATTQSTFSLNEKMKEWEWILRGAYILSLIIRFLCIFPMGYIFPDEFFQSPSFTSSIVFRGLYQQQVDLGWNNNLTTYNSMNGTVLDESFLRWEFTFEFPQRNTLIPLIFTGIPLYVVKIIMSFCKSMLDRDEYLQLLHQYSPLIILYAPKILLFFLSFLNDMFVWKLLCSRDCKASHQFKGSSLRSLSSKSLFLFTIYSFFLTTLVFSTRTFANTISGALFALFLLMEMKRRETGSTIYLLWNAIIFSLGFFSNFIFAFYATPVALMSLLSPLFEQWHSSFKTKFLFITRNIVTFGFTALMACSFLILLDSIFFFKYFSRPNYLSSFRYLLYKLNLISDWNDPTLSPIFNSSIVIAPLNNIIYNSYVENLAIHTLHPRYIHSLINSPLLFGFTYFAFCFRLFRWIAKYISRLFLSTHWNSSAVGITEIPYIIWIAFLSALSGLIILSYVPHQEPRFILPSFCCLVILSGYDFERMDYSEKKNDSQVSNTSTNDNSNLWPAQTKKFLFLCILHGILLSIFYTLIHQVGVVSSITSLPSIILKSQTPNSKEIEGRVGIVYHNTYSAPHYLLSYFIPTKISVTDLAGVENPETLLHTINEQFMHNDRILVVGPKHLNAKLLRNSSYTQLKPLATYFHFNTEYIQPITRDDLTKYPSLLEFFRHYKNEYLTIEVLEIQPR
ncbi:hypothetical protein C9374_008366 [Naegleria lovaniensis]|uniref:Mannosyltransferase n=1 Tax=Naegleria lovaniensis TaxID=51637 RepID=A0AA88KHV4_NAELO|nr:uncharacterized protein C9374_008366 [Naegleria lovaniensis]KAG2378223.1 hypothetical protein C9374_008366 [Naegleria lovaniensis]